MKMSVREARAQFAAAISAAQGGERVTITKNGKPVAEIGPPSVVEKPQETRQEFHDRLAGIRKRLGLDTLPPDTRTADEWIEDHRAWRRETLGPEYFGEERG